LIAKGEHQEQDFKFEISEVRKIAKTLSAFANTTGGRLLVGVKDNGKIAGIRSDEELHMVASAAQLYCTPEIAFTTHVHKVEGKTVLEVVIAQGVHKPYYALDFDNKRRAYLRIGDQNILASAVHLRVWQMESKERGALVKYSKQEQLLLDYLNKNQSISISQYAKIAAISRPKAIDTLAKFVRFNITAPLYTDEGFVYALV